MTLPKGGKMDQKEKLPHLDAAPEKKEGKRISWLGCPPTHIRGQGGGVPRNCWRRNGVGQDLPSEVRAMFPIFEAGSECDRKGTKPLTFLVNFKKEKSPKSFSARMDEGGGG